MDWVKIFSSVGQMESSMVINKPRLLLVRNKRLCLIRMENQIVAVEDKCPHNGESLSRGQVNFLGEVVCPWHNYRFDLTTGRESGERTRDLTTYPVKMDSDGVFVGL